MKRLLPILALTATALSLLGGIGLAELASKSEADNVAANWVTYIVGERGTWAGVSDPRIGDSQEIIVSDTLLGWYFSVEPRGHVIVPALMELPPVKLYSDEYDLNMQDTGGPARLIREILQDRTRKFSNEYGTLEAAQPKTGNLLFDPVNRKEWEKFSASKREFHTGYNSNKMEPLTEVGPLLTTAWDQNGPYNLLCPLGYGGRCVVGCVATAAAQVLRYYMYPEEGFGSHCYEWDGDQSCSGSTDGETLCADFSDPYAWSDMPDDCDSGCTQDEKDALAELCYEVGVAFEMDYGRCGSGAYTSWAVSVFPTFFGYSGLANRQDRHIHTASSWFQMIQTEVNAGRPMLYSFYGTTAGHALVCDGWRDTGGQNQYHMNYGWGGPYTGWYTIDNMYGSVDPDDESLIRNLMPLDDPPQIVCDSFSETETSGNGSGYFEPGESIDLTVTLLNTGPGVDNVSADISAADPDVSIASGSASYGTIPLDGTSDSSPPYSVSLDSLSTADAILFSLDVSGDSYSDSTDFYLGVSDSLQFIEWEHSCLSSGFRDQWHLSSDRNHTPGGSVSWKCGDMGGGKYSGRLDASLVSEAFEIEEDDIFALTFWHWLEAEQGWDGGILEISVDGGPYEQLTPVGGYTHTIHESDDNPLPGGTPCYSGSVDWEAVQVDLTPYSGTVRVRFRFASDAYTAREGWYIDDVVLSTVDFADGTAGPLADPGNGCGVSWGDYDGDGDEDLYVANSATANRLLRNDGAGSFADVSDVMTTGDMGYGHSSTWGDYDNDGDLDLYLVNGGANRLFRNDDTTFVDATSGVLGDAGWAWNGAWVDYDNDGELDLYIVNYNGTNKLLRNDSGTFSDVSSGAIGDAGHGHGAAWADYDNDGDQDVYIGNEGANKLIRNDGGGVFVDVTSAVTGDEGWARGVAWADYDNDGDFDLYIANYGTANKLLRNDGGTFVDVTASPLDDPGYGQGVAWADYDHDGDSDLYLVNYGSSNKLFRNDGGSFADVTTVATGHTGNDRGAAWADYDDDGDMDFYVAHSDGANLLLKYVGENDNHWLHVRLVGTESNASGIGARVRVVTPGGSQMREISGGDGYCSQGSLTAEFGLGSSGAADTVVVTWPSGIVQTLRSVPADTVLVVVEEDLTFTAGISSTQRVFEAHSNYPNPFNPSTTISFEIPRSQEVSLKVYDVSGRMIRELLADEYLEAGVHRLMWDGKDERERPVASGVYYYKLVSGEFSESRAMVLLK
jgi:hypothetical protein